MSKINRNLLVAAAVLFLVSVLTWRQSVERADRFQRGQLLLANLNPDEVARIDIAKGDETTTLTRQGQQFVVAEKQGYPASNASVNRFLRDLLEVGLERVVGSGESLSEELGIEPPTDETVEVALGNTADKEMVRLRIGKGFEDGPGNYVRRLDEADAPIYLTSTGLMLSSDAASYLEKQIVDHSSSEVRKIEGEDFVLERASEGGGLELSDLPQNAKLKTSEVNRLGSILSGLRFDDVWVADDPAVDALAFEEVLRIELEDGSGYVLSWAGKDDKSYLKIRGYNSVQQVAITVDESEEELKEKADLLSRADEIDEFNNFHGSWVYEIGEWTAEKLQLRRKDLIDSESA